MTELTSNEMDNLKAQLESFKVENEQFKNKYDKTVLDYELKLQNLKNEIEGKNSLYGDLSLKLNDLDDRYKNSCKEKIYINQQLQNITEEKLKLAKEINELEFEHNRILETVSRRETDLVNSKNEIEQLKASLKNYETLEIQLKVKEKEYDLLNSDFTHSEEVRKQTNLRQSERIKDLEKKLQDTTNELFEIKSEYNKQIYNLNIDLDNKRTENKMLMKNTEKMRQEMTIIEKVKEEQSASLQSAIESQTNIDNVLRNEIQVQKSLAELYKEERDECLRKEKRLIDAVTNLQNALRDACGESDRVKEDCENRLKVLTQQVQVMSHNLESQKKELESANELMDKFRVNSLSEQEMRSMNPSTAAGISALKKGYSITQIYCEYQQVVNERDEMKVERDRLNEYLKEVLDELELKAPIIKRNQTEYSSLEKALMAVSKKYDEVSEQYLASQGDYQLYQNKCSTLQKTLNERDMECKDLSRQVCYLLKEIETNRGTVIRSTMGYRGNEIELTRKMNERVNPLMLMDRAQSSQPTTAEGVITNYMVTFKNIVELQQQNQHLIKQIRLLSEEHEQIENIITEQGANQLARSLDKSFQEIEQLKSKVKQYENLQNVIEQQRHIIHALHCKLTSDPNTSNKNDDDLSVAIELVTENKSSQLMTIRDKDRVTDCENNEELIKEIRDKLKESQQKCETLELEIKQFYKEKDELKEKYRGEIDLLHDQLSENKISNATLLGKIAQSQDQNKILEQNLIHRQIEMNDLETNLSIVTKQLEQKTDQLKNMKQQLQQVNDRKHRLEISLQQMQDEQELTNSLREQIREERQQKHELVNMKNIFSEQIESLKSMVTNMPRNRTNSSGEFEEDLALLAEVRHLQLQLKQEKLKYDAGLEIWKSKLAEANIKIESLSQQNQKQELERNNSSNNRTEKRLSSTLMVTDTISDTIEDSGLLEIKNKNEMEKNIDNLTKSNETLQLQIETFKNLLEEAENKILNNTDIIDNLNREFEKKLNQEKSKTTELEKTISNLQVELQAINEEKDDISQHFVQQLQDYREQLTEKEKEMAEFENKESEFKTQIAEFKKDSIRLHNSLQLVSDNYHQELVFHAQDSEDLKVTTEKLKKYQTQETENINKLQELESERDTLHVLHTTLQTKFDEETKSRDKDLEQVRKERAVLVAQTAQLTDTVVSLKKMLDPSLCGEIERSVLEKESDWTDVIRYLRDEKEISERSRLKLEHDLKKSQITNAQLQKQIQSLKDALDEEKSLQQHESETQKHHVEVMRELEQLEMIKESNVKLREDRKRLQDELEARQKQITQLKQLSDPNSVDLKQKEKRIQELEVDVSCLEKEREHWREMSNNLISRLNQVNPEEFQKICDEKQELLNKISELEGCLSTQAKEITDNEEKFQKSVDEINELKTSTEKHQQELQAKESTICQLREIGRRYKSETESLKSTITEVNNQTNTKDEEISQLKQESEKVKEELSKSKVKIQQLSTQLASSQQTSQPLDESEVQKRVDLEKKKLQDEIQMRNSITTKRIMTLSEQCEKMKLQMQMSGIPFVIEDDNEDVSTTSKPSVISTIPSSSMTTSSITTTVVSTPLVVPTVLSVCSIANSESNPSLTSILTTTTATAATTSQTQPPVARVTASIQPTNLSKPLMSSAQLTSISLATGTTTISTSASNQVTPIIPQAARQTVEIRPIPIITPQVTQQEPVNMTTVTNTPISSSSTSAPTTTTLFPSIISAQDSNAQLEINSSSIPTTTTTSLPANVVQVLSSSSLMFPTTTSPADVVTSVLMDTANTSTVTSVSSNRKRILPTSCENITSSTNPQSIESTNETTSSQQATTQQFENPIASTSTNLFATELGPTMKKAKINLFNQSISPVVTVANTITPAISVESSDVTRSITTTSSLFASTTVPIMGFSASVFGSSVTTSGSPTTSSIFKTSVKDKQDFSNDDDDDDDNISVTTTENVQIKLQQKDEVVIQDIDEEIEKIDEAIHEDIDDVGVIEDDECDNEDDDEDEIKIQAAKQNEECRKKLLKTNYEEDVIELSSSGNDSEPGELKEEDDDVTIQSDIEEQGRNLRMETNQPSTSHDKHPVKLKINRTVGTSFINRSGINRNLAVKNRLNSTTNSPTSSGNPITVIGSSNNFSPNTPSNEMRSSRPHQLLYSHRIRGTARRQGGNFGRSTFGSNLARRSGRRY